MRKSETQNWAFTITTNQILNIMKTIQINLYSFDELSQKAQSKALEAHRNVNVNHNWFEHIHDVFAIENSKYFEITNIYFSGFWSQGDGVMFEYSNITTQFLNEIIDTLELTNWKKDILKNTFFDARGKQTGHYFHVNTCNHSFDFENHSYLRYPNLNDFLSEYSDIVSELIIDRYEELCRTLYNDLEEDYDYLTSDEAIAETFVANEYLFTEDGLIYSY